MTYGGDDEFPCVDKGAAVKTINFKWISINITLGPICRGISRKMKIDSTWSAMVRLVHIIRYSLNMSFCYEVYVNLRLFRNIIDLHGKNIVANRHKWPSSGQMVHFATFNI